MKRFISRILLVAALCLTVLTLMDFCISSRLRRGGRYEIGVWDDLARGRVEADLVVLGSSEAVTGVNPAILDSILNTNSFNLSEIGRYSIKMMDARWAYYTSRNPLPSALVLSVGLLTISGGPVEHAPIVYYPFFWDRAFRKEALPNLEFPLSYKLFPMYRYNWTWLNELFSHKRSGTYKGFQYYEMEWDRESWKSQFWYREEYQFWQKDDSVFRSFLERLQNQGVKVILVSLPVFREHREAILNYEEMKEYYSVQASRIGVPFLDYTTLGMCDDTTYFFDGAHLNARGAEIFSDTLARDLSRLGLID